METRFFSDFAFFGHFRFGGGPKYQIVIFQFNQILDGST